jgi:hypothetical protein
MSPALDLPNSAERPGNPTSDAERKKAECDEEWEHAYEFCDKMEEEGKLGPRSAWGANYDKCLMGQVSERCGDNAVVKSSDR